MSVAGSIGFLVCSYIDSSICCNRKCNSENKKKHLRHRRNVIEMSFFAIRNSFPE